MKRKLLTWTILVVMVLTLLTGTALADGTATNYTVSANEARNGVARIVAMYEADLYNVTIQNGSYYLGDYAGPISGYSSGTCFGVGEAGKETDVFITNRHVVTEEDGLITLRGTEYYKTNIVFTGYYILLDDYAYNSASFTIDTSRAVPCSVIYVGEDDAKNTRDVAILRAAEPVSGRVALALQDSEDSLKEGDSVTALGYPSSSDSATSEGYLLASVNDITLTNGVVSRFFETTSVTTSDDGALSGRFIQSTASINGGNSGGPLLDENGTVVGINTFTYHGGSQSVTNAYYALRIQYAKDALDSLGIDYEVYKPGPSGVLIAVIVIVVLALAAVAVVLVLKKKKLGPVAPVKPTDPVEPVDPLVQPVIAGDSGLRFQAVSGCFEGKRFAIGTTVRIGRDPSKNDLVYPVDAQGISGVHCILLIQDGQLYLKDLGSTYGTYLGSGQRLAANQAAQLQVGDQFYLGSEKERFVITRKGGV